jgi:dihydrofolate reductase
MRPTLVVYIATSIDGYISRQDGSIDWLTPFEDTSAWQRFESFLSTVNAIVMGRNIFLQVLSFESWPYHEIPVYALSKSLTTLPESSPNTVQLRSCSIEELLTELSSKNFQRIYVDGGKMIQSFFEMNLIDELIITRIPIILGSGRTLFGPVPVDLKYQHISTEVLAMGMVQSKYVRA